MRNIFTYILKGAAVAVALLLFYIAVPYLVCPIYNFESSRPFCGTHYYNPYQHIGQQWQIANFHTHSKAWAGITDGKNCSKEDVIAAYKQLGYNHIGISNYQRITCESYAYGQPYITIPSYEHGINVKKRHQLVLGADRVLWMDFFMYQSIHHKQYMLNKLRSTGDVVVINHPQFCEGYKPQDFTCLSNYDAIEVFNHYRSSVVQWDSALSSGHYAVLLANDDMHQLSRMDEISSNFTVVNTDELTRSHIIQALKQGQHFGVRVHRKPGESMQVKQQRIAHMVYPISIRMQGDTLTAIFTRKVNSIAFIGQGGECRQVTQQDSVAGYVMKDADTYIRIEVYDNDSNYIIFNPIVRCEHMVPAQTAMCCINGIQTGAKYATELLCILLLLWIIRRKKYIKTGQNMALWMRSSYNKYIVLIVGASLLLRAFLGGIMELSNDELYYRMFAMFPHWSYFDHPPMVGWLINITSLHLLLDNTFFIRLGAIVLCTVNSWLVYDIARRLNDDKTGLMAVLLFNLSPYVLIVTGTFIIPDAGLMFFALMALRESVRILVVQDHKGGRHFLAMGLWIGLACLSKYTAVMLWAGIGIYVLIYDRKWLKNIYLYLAVAITLLCCMPVLCWNIDHNFISFTYHGSRVALFTHINAGDFFTEIAGECLYNHPILWVCIWVAVYQWCRDKQYAISSSSPYRLIYCMAIPLILVFWAFAWFKPVLPHWNAPAYTLLLFPTAHMLVQVAEVQYRRARSYMSVAIGMVVLAAVLFTMQCKCGCVVPCTQCVKDHSIEVSTCKSTAEAFMKVSKQAEQSGIMAMDAPILCPRWELAAEYEYYIARNSAHRVLTMGPLYRTHEYAWITHSRDAMALGMDMWFITDSYSYQNPKYLSCCFEHISQPYIVTVYRGSRPAKQVYIYRMQHLKRELPYIY